MKVGTMMQRGAGETARVWSLADLGRYLERDASTISRSGSAHVHQDRLATLAALIQEVFLLMNEDLPATIAWFRTPARALDWTSPRDLILLAAIFPKFANLVSEVHSGLSPCSRRVVQGSLQPRADIGAALDQAIQQLPSRPQRNTFFRAMLLRYASDPLRQTATDQRTAI